MNKIVCAVLLALASPAAAHGFKVGDIAIGHPWARETPPMAKSAAGYLTLTNSGTTDERLLGGSTPAAAGFELHQSSMAGGVMRMRPLPGGIVIHPGETVKIEPGGMHIMMTGLKAPLVAGTMVPATLRFARAGTVAIEFKVQTLDAPLPTAEKPRTTLIYIRHWSARLDSACLFG